MTEATLQNIIRLQLAVGTAVVYLNGMMPDTEVRAQVSAEIVALYDITTKWLRGEQHFVDNDQLPPVTQTRLERLALAHAWRELAIQVRTMIATHRAPKGATQARKQALDALTQEIRACPKLNKMAIPDSRKAI